MIKHIIIREIADHIRKLRFLLTASALVLMFVVASFAFVSDYGRMAEDYESPEYRAGRIISQNMQLAMIVQIPLYVQEKPSPLWFCAGGGSQMLPNLFRVDQLWNIEVRTSYFKPRENPWIHNLGLLDWVFLTGFLVSFIAIVLGYDSFSGEKEDGTLRLMLSNNIPRYILLLGKFLGIFLVIFIPLIIGQIVSLIIIQSSDSIALGASDWQSIGFVVFLSWIYLSVFILISLIISSRTHNSTTSIVILLLVWVVMTFIIPGTSGLAARIFYQLPRKEIIDEKTTAIWNDTTSRKGDYTREEKAMFQLEGLRKAAEIRNDYRQKKFTQVEVARSFSRLSPLAAFQYAAEAYSGTGLYHHKNLLIQLQHYREVVGDFLLSEERRISDDPKGILYYSTLPWKNFNIGGLPVFKEQPVHFTEGLREALLDLGLLILYGIVFFIGAFVSFLRYDVR